METWLRDHLIASGHMTETGATRQARIRTCTCRHQVLVGLDSDVAALEATCDPYPLSPLGEALALLEGRRTLTLRREGRGWVLDWRDAHEITSAPAASQARRDVVRQHRCRTTSPAAELLAPSTFPETKPPAPANARPPF